MESARDTAKKAVQSAEETLSEANETLKTLLGKIVDLLMFIAKCCI